MGTLRPLLPWLAAGAGAMLVLLAVVFQRYGPFEEKKGGGWSMGRTVVFMLTSALSYRIAETPTIGWPEAVLGIFLALAVGIQVFLQTRLGQGALAKLVGLAEEKLHLAKPPATTATTITSTTSTPAPEG
jgi:hypothetical protein